MRPFTVLFVVYFIAQSGQALAYGPGKSARTKAKRESLDDVNLREACRRVTSGMYLDSWDQMNQTKKLLESVQKKKTALDLSLANETKLITSMRSKVAASNYDLELAQKIDSKSGLIQTLQSQSDDLVTVLAKAKLDAEAARKAEIQCKSEVVPVFDIKTAKKNERPSNLEYKAACPKYRYLCPLPRDHAIRLRDVTKLEPCIRYAEQSIQNRN